MPVMGGANMLILCTVGLLCTPAVMAQSSAGVAQTSEVQDLKKQLATLQAKLKDKNGGRSAGKVGKVSREVSHKAQTKEMTEAEKHDLIAQEKRLMQDLINSKGGSLVPHLPRRETPPPTTEDEYQEQLTELAGSNILNADTSTALNGYQESAGWFGSMSWYHYVIVAGAALAWVHYYHYDLGKYLMDMRRVLIPGYGNVNAENWLKGASKAECDDLFLAGQSSYGGATMKPVDPMKATARNTATSEVISGPLGPLAPAGPLGPLAPAGTRGPLGGTIKAKQNPLGPTIANPLGSMMKPIGSNPLEDDIGL